MCDSNVNTISFHSFIVRFYMWAHNASALVTVECAIELAGFGVALTLPRNIICLDSVEFGNSIWHTCLRLVESFDQNLSTHQAALVFVLYYYVSFHKTDFLKPRSSLWHPSYNPHPQCLNYQQDPAVVRRDMHIWVLGIKAISISSGVIWAWWHPWGVWIQLLIQPSSGCAWICTFSTV